MSFELNRTFISPNDIFKIVLRVILCPLQSFGFVGFSYELAICAASECLSEICTTAQNSLLRNSKST